MSGSSPLTRGKPSWSPACAPPRRLIPAHAGKTLRRVSHGQSVPAHPRSRGENTGTIDAKSSVVGSSPLTRGKLEAQHLEGYMQRLIPAHAGKTRGVKSRGACRAAHPRSRGENPLTLNSVRLVAGSSPLTRGKLGCVLDPVPATRLIPAHAGKTLPDLRFYCADRSDLGKP